MEPIDIETIEEADRFAFGLNTEQVNEWREDYDVKHSYFLKIINSTYAYLIIKEPDDFLYRLLFVIVISFERYYMSLPEITIEEYYPTIQKWLNEFDKERKRISPSYKSKLIAARHTQPNLANYLMNKLNEDNDGWKKFKGQEKYIPVINFMTYTDTLNSAIEKLLSTPIE